MAHKAQDFAPEMRAFFNVFQQLAYRHDYARVFDDFLTIMLTQFTAPGLMEYEHRQAVSPYSAEERPLFTQLWKEYVLAHARKMGAYPREAKTKHPGELAILERLKQVLGTGPADMVRTGEKLQVGDIPWYDFLGDFYMELCGGGYKSAMMGQYFTPDEICDMMTRMTMDNQDGSKTGAGLRISDPTCGSGRMALATNSLAPGNYYSLQDLDPICCKMTVINMLMHGVMGEVVLCDALKPDDYRKGWAVNMHINSDDKFIELPNGKLPLRGVPHVFPQEKEASYVWNLWQQEARLVEKYGKSSSQLHAEAQQSGKPFPTLPPPIEVPAPPLRKAA